MFDLQVNGLTTNDFSCDFWQSPDNESIHALRKHESNEGVFMFLATVITAPYDSITANLKRIKEYKSQFDNDSSIYIEAKKNLKEDDFDMAHIYGVHVEGGLISKMGIHPEANANEFDLSKVKELVSTFPGLIKLWTLCPKLDTNGDITRFLQDSGIKVAYGHSDASYDTAMNAFDKYNVDLVTHWGNGMKTFPGFRHRGGNREDYEKLENLDIDQAIDREEIGIAVAAFKNPKVKITAICGSERDGDLHLDPYLVHKLAEAKHGNFVLVSDSVAAANGKNYEAGKLRGGTRTLGTHLGNALEAMVEIPDVQAATSITPYEVMGLT